MPHWNGIVVAATPEELKDRFRNPDGQLKRPTVIESELREAAGRMRGRRLVGIGQT